MLSSKHLNILHLPLDDKNLLKNIMLMNTRIYIGELLGFKDFFPTVTPLSKVEYAKRLGKRVLYNTSAHFLSYFRLNIIPSNEELLQDWFTYKNIKYYEVPFYHHCITRYNKISENGKKKGFAILSIESLLKLFIWLNKQPDVSEDIPNSNVSFTINLFQLYLLFNDDVLFYYNKVNKNIDAYNGIDEVQRSLLAMSFSQADFLNNDYLQIIYTQFYKAIKLLNYISSADDFKNLFSKFLAEYYSSTKEEYFRSIGSAIVLPLTTREKGSSTLTILESENFERDSLFLDKLTVESDDEKLYEQNDYLSLRSNPLFRISKGEYRIIYDLFLIKKIYNGLIFILSGLVQKDKSLFQNDFLGTIRNVFSEGTLVYEVLSSIFSVYDVVQKSGNEFKAILMKTEPDYYIRDNRSIFLFESKDFYIKGEIKLSYDFDAIEAELKKDRLSKGVKQLLKNVERALLKEMVLDINYNPDEVIIYPIIIVHDSLYSAPGLNYLVNLWFDEGLNELKQKATSKDLNTNNILPLTIVEIDTLIFYEENFKRRELILKELLNHYQDFVSFRKYDFKNVEERIEHSFNSALSFDGFVKNKCFEEKIMPQNEILNNLLREFGIN